MQPSRVIETITTIYRDIFLMKSFLLYKIYVKIKISLSKKSDQGNSIVIADKPNYLDKMENLLNDTRKFGNINLKNYEILNFAFNQEKHVDNILKELVASNSTSEETRRSLKPVATWPCIS